MSWENTALASYYLHQKILQSILFLVFFTLMCSFHKFASGHRLQRQTPKLDLWGSTSKGRWKAKRKGEGEARGKGKGRLHHETSVYSPTSLPQRQLALFPCMWYLYFCDFLKIPAWNFFREKFLRSEKWVAGSVAGLRHFGRLTLHRPGRDGGLQTVFLVFTTVVGDVKPFWIVWFCAAWGSWAAAGYNRLHAI